MFTRSKTIPAWALLSLASNGLLILTVVQLLLREHKLPDHAAVSASANATSLEEKTLRQGLTTAANQDLPLWGPRHKWTYEQWVAQLGREAEAAATNQPQRLTILAGDSLSLWFPPQLLPRERSWLNQGISGETSAGLRKRLSLFDRVQAETIFVMIGINDLIRGVEEDTILENQRQIIRDLRSFHPNAQIVVQSILPHSGEKATWEGRDRLKAIPNERIRELNRQLKAIASEEGVLFLDLHPLFADANGNLRLELSTDGLHLNDRGYWVWRSALKLYSQLELDPKPQSEQIR